MQEDYTLLQNDGRKERKEFTTLYSGLNEYYTRGKGVCAKLHFKYRNKPDKKACKKTIPFYGTMAEKKDWNLNSV